MRLLGAVLVLAVVVPAAAAAGRSATAQSGFAFGRFGGNIRPYTVTIAAGGAVHTSGPVTVGQRRLTAKQLAALRRVAAAAKFTALPAWTHCTKTNPDVASTFIRMGTRTVRVHGSCVAGYTRFWLALSRAVGLSGMA